MTTHGSPYASETSRALRSFTGVAAVLVSACAAASTLAELTRIERCASSARHGSVQVLRTADGKAPLALHHGTVDEISCANDLPTWAIKGHRE